MRWLIVPVLVGILTLMSSPGAEAVSVTGSAKASQRGTILTKLNASKTAAAGVSDPSAVVTDGRVWVRWVAFDGSGADPCTRVAGRLVDPDGQTIGGLVADRGERFTKRLQDWIGRGNPAPGACPGPAREDPLAVLTAVVREALPAIRPGVQPPGGSALVGWPVYVTLGRDPRVAPDPVVVQMLSREVTVRLSARASVRVDWDDDNRYAQGRSVEVFADTAGVRWEDRFDPNGGVPVTRVYEVKGPRTITLTDVWTVDVDASGVGAWTLTVPMDPVQVPLQLDELQAVVTQQQ